MFDLSLTKPALGAVGFFLALLFPLVPIWNELWMWFGSNKDGLQGVYYLAMSVGFLWRGGVWLNRYLRRTRGQSSVTPSAVRRIRARGEDNQ